MLVSTTNLRAAAVTVAVLLLGLQARPASAQQPSPSVNGILAGYGSVDYTTAFGEEGDRQNNFGGSLSLLPLYRIGDDILAEGELELALHDDQTKVVLEHLQLHYLGFRRVHLVAGRFHLPIGVWNHTTWVNKLPTPPLLYEDTHGGPASDALMPIPFDLGFMGTVTLPGTGDWRTSVAVWVSQGPKPGELEEDDAPPGPEPDAPRLAYGSNYGDNNTDKMVGARLRTMSGADLGLTLQATAFRSRYDDAGELALDGANAALVWMPMSAGRPLFTLKAEGTALWQDYVLGDAVVTVRSEGYYVQLSRRQGLVEPVVRWSHLPRTAAGAGDLVRQRRQLALGLVYWMSPSVPLKMAYDWELDRVDRFVLQWAVGF